MQKPWLDESLAANGRPVRENFNSWFGSGALVDANAEPLLLYHGTDRDLSSFKVSPRGSFGAGIYLANNPKQAHVFCEGLDNALILPVHVALQRPFHTSADYDAGDEVDFDSPCVPLLREVYGRHAGAVIHRLRHSETGQPGQALRQRLMEMGHDGIVARYEDGSAEVVAFFPEQVKSAIGNSGLYLRDSASLDDRQAAWDLVRAQGARNWIQHKREDRIHARRSLA
jgi:hypothetical protein